ncbi:Myeloid differentiation primary response protein MyD88 [Mactra antiquata]
MDDVDDGLTLPAEYASIPLRAINMATRRKLANPLNLEGSLVVVNHDDVEFDVVNDVTGLAELAGFQYQEIMNMKTQRSPTIEFLNQWTARNGTVGKLWELLYQIERYDVLTDCKANIIRDCDRYMDHIETEREAYDLNMEQDPTVTTSEMKVDETKFSTVHDVLPGSKVVMYDAFVCYSLEDENDRAFVRDMISVLEGERKLKLFVPGRDDLPGGAQHVISAYLIERRCKRVAIVMSKAFLHSSACDFQVKFAHALAPGARSKRLIPIIREKNTQLPRILRFLAVCDFSKPDMVEWVWDRLYAAMLAPIGPVTYFDEEDEENELRSLTFPTQPHLAMQMSVPSSAQVQGVPSNRREPVEHSSSRPPSYTQSMRSTSPPATMKSQATIESPTTEGAQAKAKPQKKQKSSISNWFGGKSKKGK